MNDELISWRSFLHDAKIRNLAAGLCAGVVSAVVTCPLDMLKVRLQNMPQQAKVVDTFVQMCRTEGVRGMYKAVGPTLVAYMPSWAVYFTVYDATKRHLKANNKSLDFGGNMIAALNGGLCSTLATNPLWVVRSIFLVI